MSLPMYPYTNMSDTNLDWLIEDNKRVHVEMSETTQYINESKTYIDGKLEDATTQAENAQSSAENAQSSAENAQSSAENASASAESTSADAEYVKSTRNQVDLLQSRVDNIIPSGTQTEGNTELIDIRVGANGVTYASAGNSVRGQFDQSEDELMQYTQLNFSRTFTLGTIKGPTHTPVENPQLMHTEVLHAIDTVHVVFDTAKYWVNLSTCTGADGAGYIGSDWKYSEFDIPADTYFWLVVRGVTAHDLSNDEQTDIQKNVIIQNKHGFAINIRDIQAINETQRADISNLKLNVGDNFITLTPYTPFLSGIYTVIDGVITLSYKGLRTRTFTPDINKKCAIRFKWSTTAASPDFRFYLFDSSNNLIDNKVFTTASGNYTYTFDPNEMYIYHSASSFYIILSTNMEGEEVVITDFTACQNDMIGQSNYDSTIWNTMARINEDVTQNSVDIANISSGDINLINPSGVKYYLTIDENGSLQTIKAIPLKALFLGNSLLFGNGNTGKAPGVDPDSNFFGMCASDNEKDYFHYISTYLTRLNASFTASKLYFSPFEHSTSESEITDYITNKLIPKLASDLDLISIQGGDNVQAANEPYFYDGMESLIQTIRKNCPNARISWMAEWFLGADMDRVKAICDKYGVKLVLIHDLNITQNQGHIGQVITNPDGTTVTVSNAAVAAHPGDLGMKLIANRYLYQMNISPTENSFE